jgi:hypothetical protein
MKPPKITFGDMWQRFTEEKVVDSPPSKQYDKLRSCQSKKVHFTKESADKAAELNSKIDGCVYVSYKCRWCSNWHVGHEQK